MKTLKELFDKYGSVWLAHEDEPNKKAFKPLGYSECGNLLYGEGVSGDTRYPSEAKIGCTSFVLYKEPKKKKIYYQYVYKSYDSGFVYIDTRVFLNDDDFKLSMCTYKVKWFKRIEPGIEVEE